MLLGSESSGMTYLFEAGHSNDSVSQSDHQIHRPFKAYQKLCSSLDAQLQKSILSAAYNISEKCSGGASAFAVKISNSTINLSTVMESDDFTACNPSSVVAGSASFLI